MSPGLYSPMRLETEPAAPILTPLIERMISLSLRPALSAGPPEMTEEYDDEL